MASIDLISAKLEAFETRMEDRLRALFTEFRLGRSPTPRRSQRGESSNRKENPPERGTSDGLIVSTHKEPEDVDPEPEKEDAETAGHQHHTCPSRPRQPTIHEGRRKLQLITILIGTGSTNNFIDNKVAARLTLWIEDCSRCKLARKLLKPLMRSTAANKTSVKLGTLRERRRRNLVRQLEKEAIKRDLQQWKPASMFLK
ncbi:hypothetical protein BHE74_00005915 [Ensete ventricosum]|nr:hypothetical protein BHE74_00005915 [Ensete ventricosum]